MPKYHTLFYLNLSLLWVIGFLFSLHIIIEYFIQSDWNVYIPKLGQSESGKILMSIHYIGGIFLMLLLPLQWSPIQQTKFHKKLGYLISLSGITVSMAGMGYILVHGTIGGVYMSFMFFLYGISLLSISIIHPLNVIRYRQPMTAIQLEQMKVPFHHHLTGMIFLLLGYGSVFYRILYTVVGGFGYPEPTTKFMYNRLLDLTFQTIFFILPVLTYLIWKYTRHCCQPEYEPIDIPDPFYQFPTKIMIGSLFSLFQGSIIIYLLVQTIQQIV